MSKRSCYQQIDIINNDNFGRIRFLNKDTQISEYDAHIDDDCMVSPIAKTKGKRNKVAILGCGDGGILWEMLKYKPKHAFLVDIDSDVVTAPEKYLKKMCGSAF